MQAQRKEDEAPAGSALHAAIESLYRAGIGDIDWDEALAKLVRAHDGDGGMLFTPELPVESGGLSVSVDANMRGGLRSIAPEAGSPRMTAGRAFSTVLSVEGDATLPATLFLLFRPEAAAQGVDEALEASCRHLALAVRLWYRERFARQGAEALAGAIGAAALIADEDGRVAWMNRRAEFWVSERRISMADGKITQVPGPRIDIARAVRDAAKAGARLVLAAEGSITIEVAPISVPKAGGAMRGLERAALILLRDGVGYRDAAASLAANYRLTATEVDLAMALWKGVLIAEYAEQRSVAMSTVRTQLKALLAKTGSRRQSDVVALVARMQPMTGIPRMDDDGASRYRRD